MRSLLAVLVLVAGCAKRVPDTAYASWVFVQGVDASGTGLKYDPALPPWREGASDVGSRRRTAWAAREVVQQGRFEWWQGMGLPLEPREIPQLDWEVMRGDTERIRMWFVERGWPDATVGVRTEQASLWFAKKGDDRFWRVIYEVTVGERSRIDRVVLTGERDLPVPARSAIRRRLPAAGSWTSAHARDALVEEMTEALFEEGFAFAQVTHSASGDPLNPTIQFHVDAGTVPTLGAIATVTDPPLDVQRLTRLVRRRMVEGDAFDGEQVRWFEEQLRGRPEIADAKVLPAQDGDEAHVAVEILPEPAREQNFGIQAGVTGALLTLGAQLDWARRGLGGRFLTLSGVSTVDYRLFDRQAGLFTGLTHGPGTHHVVELDGALKPLWGLSSYLKADGDLETWRGYVEVGGFGEVGLRWKPWGQSQVRAFVRAGYRHHFPWPWQTEAFDTTFTGQRTGTGEWFRRSYGYTAVGAAIDIERRPHDFASERGTMLHVEFIPFGQTGQTRWTRFDFDLRWHANAVPGRLVFIARVAAGGHVIDDHDSGSLMHNRFFLGGPGNGRGFGFRRLGSPGGTASLEGVRTGGDYMGFVSLDARIQLHPAVFVSPFFEVGRVWASGFDQRREGQGVVQQGIRLGQVQPVAGATFVLSTAGRWIEFTPGFRLTRETWLAEPVGVVTFQLRLRPDPRKQ